MTALAVALTCACGAYNLEGPDDGLDDLGVLHGPNFCGDPGALFEAVAAGPMHGFGVCPACREETALQAPGIVADHGDARGDCAGGGQPCAS